MNIFFLDENPVQAAQWMVDRHVVKMILESAQLLSTAHRILDYQIIHTYSPEGKKRSVTEYLMNDARDDVIYRQTHISHPCAIWARESVENYNWLVDHFFALMEEYTLRYNKQHACYGELSVMLASPPKNLEKWDMTPVPCAMDDKYIISDNPVENYRNYYKLGKQHLHAWKIPEHKPDWI
jgi:hypothetical protein